MFNKMSSLCCAAAAPGLAIPSHFFASPFHCRANQRFAFASRLNSMPSPSPAPQRFAFASQNVALPRLAFALPVCASQCRRDAVGRSALPLHSSSPHSLRKASPCHAVAIPLLALPLRIFSNHGNAAAMQITVALRRAIARPI
jgi:hypothetical protein